MSDTLIDILQIGSLILVTAKWSIFAIYLMEAKPILLTTLLPGFIAGVLPTLIPFIHGNPSGSKGNQNVFLMES